MIVYGRNPVREALRGRRAERVGPVWATRSALREDWLPSGRAELTEDSELERLSGSVDHQGICAEAGDYPYAEPDRALEPEDALVVVLDQVQDPRNLGAACRVAEAAGAAAVVVPERRATAVTPAVCKASAGAVEHLAVVRVPNVAEFLGDAKRRGAWVYGAAAGAGTSYAQPDYRGRVVLVLGSEGAGIRPRVAKACDQLVELPMRGRVESLNVSAAAAALLYGILQRRESAVDRAP